jgi:hypothetical protein
MPSAACEALAMIRGAIEPTGPVLGQRVVVTCERFTANHVSPVFAAASTLLER